MVIATVGLDSKGPGRQKQLFLMQHRKRIMKESDLFSSILQGYKWSRTLFVKARVRDVAIAETERLSELDIKSSVWKSFQKCLRRRICEAEMFSRSLSGESKQTVGLTDKCG